MRIGIQAKRIFRTKKDYCDIIASNIVRSLQDLDTVNEYFVFTEKRQNSESFYETPNFKFIELPKQSSLIWEQVTLPKEVKRYKLDILHCLSGIPPLYSDLKLIMSVNSADYKIASSAASGVFQRVRKFYNKTLIARSFSKADKLIVTSEFERNQLMSLLKIPAKTKLIYNGVSPVFFTEPRDKKINAVKEKYSLPDKFILVQSNLENTGFGLYRILRAYQFFTELHKEEIPLVILNLSRAELVKQIVDGNLNPAIYGRIRLVDLEHSADLQYIYKLSTLFLNTDGHGISMLEAMASGVPVIAQNTTLMSEIGGRAATLVEVDGSADLAVKMARIISDRSLRNDLIFKGRTRSLEFTWKEAAEKTLNTYYELVLGGSTSFSDV